uniref:Uncharacterized protein n=1 Tax=viral metagenome TaxID=1070528 RepID=A0A6C0LGM9_9ZZZZ
MSDQATLQQAVLQIAREFDTVLSSSEVPGQNSAASIIKGQQIAALVSVYSNGIGMLSAMMEIPVSHVMQMVDQASGRGATINTYIGGDMGTSVGFGLTDTKNQLATCGPRRGGRKGKKGMKQHGGLGIPNRYDILTMILLGTAGAQALSAAGGASAVSNGGLAAFNYVSNMVIDYAISIGLFKQPCGGPAATSWNILLRATIGAGGIPVESCADKIMYNDQQVIAIKAMLVTLCGTLGGVTAAYTASSIGRGMSYVYQSIKENISKPIFDYIMLKIAQGVNAIRSGALTVCQYVTGSSGQAPATKEKADQASNAGSQLEAKALTEAEAEVRALIASVVKSGGGLSLAQAEAIVAQLKQAKIQTDPVMAATFPERSAAEKEGGSGKPRRRRTKATTRKGKKVKKGKRGKKSKTVKRGRKPKSSRKVKKGKGKATRRSKK